MNRMGDTPCYPWDNKSYAFHLSIMIYVVLFGHYFGLRFAKVRGINGVHECFNFILVVLAIVYRERGTNRHMSDCSSVLLLLWILGRLAEENVAKPKPVLRRCV